MELEIGNGIGNWNGLRIDPLIRKHSLAGSLQFESVQWMKQWQGCLVSMDLEPSC